MRVFKTKWFSKWASKNDVSDQSLVEAAFEVKENRYEANYGHGLIKKRVANKNRGKSGSTRTILAFKKGTDCFFIYGFEKSEKENISTNEEKALKIIANELLTYSDSERKIKELLSDKSLIEVRYEEK